MRVVINKSSLLITCLARNLSVFAEHGHPTVKAVSSCGNAGFAGSFSGWYVMMTAWTSSFPVPLWREALSGLRVVTAALPNQARTAMNSETCTS